MPSKRHTFWALAAMIVLAGIGVWAFATDRTASDARLKLELESLRKSGDPLSLKDLERKPPLPEDNAATYLRRARDYVDAIDKEVYAAYENESPADQEATDLGQLSPGFVKALRAALAAYPKAIPLLEQAARAGRYDAQLNIRDGAVRFNQELWRQTQWNRQAMRTLNNWALLQIVDGKTDDAVRTCLLMVRLCRHFDEEPTLVGCLVALACRGVVTGTCDLALRSGVVSPVVRDALDAELKQHDLPAVYRRSLAEERAFGLQLISELAAGRQRPFQGENLEFMWQAAQFQHDQPAYLDYINEFIRLADQPFSTSKGQLRVPVAMAEALTPNILASQAALGRGQVFLRSLRILNALQRLEAENPGGQPTLSDLKLPAEITTDPFNGEPLHLVKKPAGWLIYSVDMNLKDDGGLVGEFSDTGFGPLPRTRIQ